jgi:hypothetical protein
MLARMADGHLCVFTFACSLVRGIGLQEMHGRIDALDKSASKESNREHKEKMKKCS